MRTANRLKTTSMRRRALYKEGADNEDLVCMYNLGRFIWEHSDEKNADERKQPYR